MLYPAGDLLLQVVGSFRNPAEAHLAQGALEAEGIQAELSDAYTVGVNWLYSDAIGGVKLLVQPEQAALAAEILRGSHALATGDDLENPEHDGKGRLQNPTLPRIVGMATVLLAAVWMIPQLFVALPIFKRRRR